MGLEDKTEAATPRRRQDARLEGQVARSHDLSSALVLIASLLLIKVAGPMFESNIRKICITSFTHFSRNDIVIGDVQSMLVRLLLQTGLAIAPLVLGVAVVGGISCVMQVGLVFSTKSLQFKGERLNPLSGIARMFSPNALVELVKSILKVSIIGFVVFSFLRDNYSKIASLVDADYLCTVSTIGNLVWTLLFKVAMMLFAISALDYMYQRFNTEKQLKMTKQEVKDDMKRTEGDPVIKGKIRQMQRQMSQRRMMSEVPKADVVVTNPTHFAVALKYEKEKSAAPIVVAKGKDLVAQRIKAIAKENNVPMVENVPLARALYASVDIGKEIPAEMYQAVAEILAYVYKLSKKLHR